MVIARRMTWVIRRPGPRLSGLMKFGSGHVFVTDGGGFLIFAVFVVLKEYGAEERLCPLRYRSCNDDYIRRLSLATARIDE